MGEKVKKIMDFSDKIIPRDDKKTLSEVGSAKISYGHFNLNRFPWWGGQFERMIGLVKAALNKTTVEPLLSGPGENPCRILEDPQGSLKILQGSCKDRFLSGS